MHIPTITSTPASTRSSERARDEQGLNRPSAVRLRLWPVVVAVSLASSWGCASVGAKAPVVRPALVVPPAPPRIIEPAPLDSSPDPVPELPAPGGVPAAPPARPGRSAPRESAKPEPPKPVEPKPVDPPPVEPPPPATPVAQLRTPQTADSSGAAKAVRTTLDTAQGVLNSVNYAPLSNVRKKAYNDAKLFIHQAEDALKEGNLVFAQAVANKAESLAKELAGR